MTRQGSLYWDRPDPAKRALAARNGMAVIADGAGLLVLDVSDPWRPREVGRWSNVWTRDVALVGSVAVVTLGSWATPGDTGAVIVDLADPANPTMIGSWPAPSAVLSVAEYGGAVAVGTDSDGVFVLDLGDPARPAVADHWESDGRPVDDLASAWPTVVATHSRTGLTALGLDRSCVPPRSGSSRPGPAQGPSPPVTAPPDPEPPSRILGRTSGSSARPGSASAVVTPK